MGQSQEAALPEARQFVYTNSFATLTTINQKGPFANMPMGQIEYYADTAADDASLLLISVDMSSSFRNIAQGSPASLVIRTGDQPGATAPSDVAAHARIVLYGEISEPVDPSETDKSRFFSLHPDARAWEPGTPGFHKTVWVRFLITGIYYIGGFGDTHYIGTLPVVDYANVKPWKPSKSIVSRLLMR